MQVLNARQPLRPLLTSGSLPGEGSASHLQ